MYRLPGTYFFILYGLLSLNIVVALKSTKQVLVVHGLMLMI